MQCEISHDFSKVMLSVGKETYMLTYQDEGYTQKYISWLKQKTIGRLIATSSDFLFITHADYDKQYTIRSSRNDNFKITIAEKISPNGCQKVLDAL